ncbi:hypothetical protein [Streptomyces sp. AC555_RSS877]|uniref:hypothetical protein n=1 Tax=Streptomyces sp. AC555_RSS877 TaxID=2823688 RepID=UPI001C258B4D|nr:hypothetical protein [Streptomyces sp. AC555_RSS877]
MPAQPEPTDRAEVTKLANAVEEALLEAIPKSFRDDSPVPLIGSAPPVAQPGVPPMSQRATDIGRLITYSSLATVPPGLIAIGLMLASEHANPTVIGMICAAPAAIAVPILAFARLLRGAKDVLPSEIHQHYNGTVIQQTTHSETRGVWARTNNQLPK